MELKHTLKMLQRIMELEIPVSNTTRGEQIQQTYRNNLTTKLKEALFKDCSEAFNNEETTGIIPYLTKEGVVLELPNESVADNTDPNMCNGAISIEFSFAIKSLEYDATEASKEYDFAREQARKRAEETEAKKQAKIAKDKAARAERERKRMRAIQAAMAAEDDSE